MFITERLYYRSLIEEDVNDFYEIFKSDKVNEFVKKMSFEQVKKIF